jgi:outer membrane lipoprotein-sorting protein
MSLARLVATLLLCASSATAQNVDEIVSRYLVARGGLERIRSIESLRMSGTLTPGSGPQGAFRLELKRPGRMRVETVVQGTTVTQATDGREGWVLAPLLAGGSAVILPPEEARSLHDQADIEGPLVGWKAKGHRLEVTGKDARFGADAFRLKLVLKSGDVRYLYIDAASYRQVAEEGERPSPRGLVRIETRLSDHRLVDGLLIPFVLEIEAAGAAETQRIAFETVEVNPTLDASRFAVPAGAKRPPPPPK